MSAPGSKRATAGRSDWRTPPELFEVLDREFGFTLDGAASEDNHLLPRFLTAELDAHKSSPEREVIFLNPPYGEALERWAATVRKWQRLNCTVVTLVPSATETGWFWNLWTYASEVRFLRPRVRFLHPDTGLPGDSNTSGSALFVHRPQRWYVEFSRGSSEHVFLRETGDYPTVSLWEWRRHGAIHPGWVRGRRSGRPRWPASAR